MARFYISFEATEQQLRDFFSPHKVGSVKLITDRDTGRSKGFGFVDIDGVTIEQIVEEFDNREFLGRSVVVNEARDKQPAGAARGRGRGRDDRRERRAPENDYAESWKK